MSQDVIHPIEKWPRAAKCVALALALSLCWPQEAAGYSVLTHEEVVDLLWADHIKPLLRQRFPASTEDDLVKAHAYAYGGCVIQDMGYYPFGNKEFSNLVHYVRSGDFVERLIEDSKDVNGYAFALGALAHYASDNTGHPFINRAVALQHPRLRAKYGDAVTYAQDPKAHIRTEFGFDVTQVAKHRYASDAYHDFIGFQVDKPLLEQAFRETYGIELSDVFGSLDLAIGTYRRSISKVIPEMTRVALVTKRADLVRETPNFSKEKFLYRLSRAEYEKEWGTDYRKPGFGTRVLAFFFHIIPKVGPFKAIDFDIPTKQTEDMFVESVNHTVDAYTELLKQAGHGPLQLPNRDCDTGKATVAGEYKLTDATYAKLLDRLADRDFDLLTPELQANIQSFYANPDLKFSRKSSQMDRKRQEKLESLLAVKTQPGALQAGTDAGRAPGSSVR